MLFGYKSETDRANRIVNEAARQQITDKDFIVKEIDGFKRSQKRIWMQRGDKYYRGEHDILQQKREMIGASGELEEVKNLPNHKIVDNQYKKMVVQKSNYLLGQPISFKTDNTQYAKVLRKTFGKRFQKLIKNIGENSLNCGISWLHIYYNNDGELAFKRFPATQVVPQWKDAEHEVLDYLIRFYPTILWDGQQEKEVERVEVYKSEGIYKYILEGSSLQEEEEFFVPYFYVVEGEEKDAYNWSKIPVIPFKYNNSEIPLIKNVKTLQDAMNTIESSFQNNMCEDTRNTILVLVNYDGTDLGDFRKNLSTYGAVKIRDADGSKGDVRTLHIEVNAENYRTILEILKKAIIENAMGYDAKDDRMGGSPNQMNIESMYNDIDLDANSMETEYQASFEELLWFINMHLNNTGQGDFEDEEVEVIFNRDMLINEKEAIESCQSSVGVLSLETIVSQHPWVDDVVAELERIKAEKQEEIESYGYGGDPFRKQENLEVKNNGKAKE